MMFDGDTFEHAGLTFTVSFPYDDGHRAPWEENDCHGPVRTGKKESKYPGERILYTDRSHATFYDWQEAVKIAKREGWGGEGKTRGERAHNAVEKDFQYLKSWCDNEWTYIGVCVKYAPGNQDEIDLLNGAGCDGEASVWGVESDAYDYHKELARDLADEIASRVGKTMDKLTRVEIRWLAMIAAGYDGEFIPDDISSELHCLNARSVFDCYEFGLNDARRILNEKGWAALKEYQDEQEDKVRLP